MKKLAFLSALLASTAAHATDIPFSFTNTIGDVSGTVTGRIIGLVDNSTSAATAIYIDSFPTALNSAFGSPPIDVFAWNDQWFYVGQNSFTLSNGVLTSAQFFVQAQDDNGFFQLWLNGDGNTNFLSLDGLNNLYVYTVGELNSETGLQVGPPIGNSQTAPIPEPASWAMMVGGFGLAGAALRRRRKTTVAFA